MKEPHDDDARGRQRQRSWSPPPRSDSRQERPPPSRGGPLPQCRYFAMGMCRAGSSCRFPHVSDGPRRGRNSSPARRGSPVYNDEQPRRGFDMDRSRDDDVQADSRVGQGSRRGTREDHPEADADSLRGGRRGNEGDRRGREFDGLPSSRDGRAEGGGQDRRREPRRQMDDREAARHSGRPDMGLRSDPMPYQRRGGGGDRSRDGRGREPVVDRSPPRRGRDDDQERGSPRRLPPGREDQPAPVLGRRDRASDERLQRPEDRDGRPAQRPRYDREDGFNAGRGNGGGREARAVDNDADQQRGALVPRGLRERQTEARDGTRWGTLALTAAICPRARGGEMQSNRLTLLHIFFSTHLQIVDQGRSISIYCKKILNP